jgi:hypothetical protein
MLLQVEFHNLLNIDFKRDLFYPELKKFNDIYILKCFRQTINSDFKNNVPTIKFQKKLVLFCKLFIS